MIDLPCMHVCIGRSARQRGPVQGPGDGHRGRLLLLRRRPPWRRGEPALRVHGAARADPGPEHVQITGILNFNPCLTPNDVILAS